MKKRISLILMLILALGLCVAVGFNETPATKDIIKNEIIEDVAEKAELSIAGAEETDVSETKANEISTQIISNENVSVEDKSYKVVTDVLTIEDKAVKTEISKHSNTKVDFRYNKQEIIQDKKFNMTFSELDETFDNKKIKYTNAENDTFVYELDSGKLFYARIRNAIVSKTGKSIGIEKAKKIATDYILEKCNLDGYTLYLCEETEEGYMFAYSKYYGGYKTDDSFGVGVGFNGSIFYIRDNTDLFDGVDLSVDADWIEQKISETLLKYEETTAEVDYENTYITLENEKPCLFVAINYGVSPDGTIGSFMAVHTVPIE